MKNEEAVRYLANIYHILASDSDVGRDEERLLEEVSREIGAGYPERRLAKELAKSQGIQTHVAARWSDRIGNLEDMIFAAYSNEVLEPAEKQAIVEYAKHLDIDQKQLNLIKQEAKRRHEESQ